MEQDQDGRTALHYACDVDSKAGIAEVLVSAGADAHGSDFSGLTPIHLARQSGARAVLASLERTQRNSWRGQSMNASVGPCIPLSPLQVDIDKGLWSSAPRAPAGRTPPGRTGAGMAPASPTAHAMNAYGQPMMARAGSPASIIDGGMAGGRGEPHREQNDGATG